MRSRLTILQRAADFEEASPQPEAQRTTLRPRADSDCWTRASRAATGDAWVQCDDCNHRERVTIVVVLRTNRWPECHDQVMRLLHQDEVDRLRAKPRAATPLAEGEHDTEPD